MIFDKDGKRIKEKDYMTYVEVTELDSYNEKMRYKYILEGFDGNGNRIMSKHTNDLARADEIKKDYTDLGYIVKRFIMVEV